MAEEKRYTLRVPFQVQPGYGFGSTGISSRTSYGRYSVSLDQIQDGYALNLDGFPSSESASQFRPRVWTGLATLMLERGSAFSGSMDLGPVAYTEAPKISPGNPFATAFKARSGQDLEGIADGDAPSVYPSGKGVAFVQMGTPEVQITIPAGTALQSILKGFEVERADQLFLDERFRTAIELYAAASFEQSPTARLLTLSMVFEVLAPVTYRHGVVQQLIDGWKGSVEAAKALNTGDPTALSAIESLEKELLFKREASIRSRIRTFVISELGADAAPQARRVGAAYDARSTLLHDGRLDEVVRGNAITDFTDVAKQIMLRRITLSSDRPT